MHEITSKLSADPLDFLVEMYGARMNRMNAEDAQDRAAGIDLQAAPASTAKVAEQSFGSLEVQVTGITYDFVPRRTRLAAAVLTLAALAACSNAKPTASVSPTPSASSSATPGMPTVPGNGQVQEETDQSLAGGGYNCGHTVEIGADGSFDYAPQINYLNSQPDLAKNLIDFQINNPKWGMGIYAWNILKTQAYANPETPTSTVVNGNDDMNTYAHGIWTMALNDKYTGVNFTCATKDGTIEPVSEVGLKSQNHVSGFLVTAATKDAFLQVAHRYPDGSAMFDAILTDMQIKDANGNDVQIFMIVTEFEGCDNPTRLAELIASLQPTQPAPQQTFNKKQPGPTPSQVVETPGSPSPSSLPSKVVNPAKPVPGPGQTSPLPKPVTLPVPDNGQPNPGGNNILNSPEPVATNTPLKVEPIPSLQPSPQASAPAG